MTDNELDQLMQRVLLDAIKRDCEKENSVVPSFEPSLRYQRSLAAMIADPLKWAHKRAKPLWKNILQKVAVVLIIFSLSLGSLMVVSPNIRAAVVNWVTEWYETHITYRYLGTPTDNEMPKYRIEALPNGYVEVDSEREEWPEYICIVYRNEVSGKTIYFDYTRMTQGYVNDFEVNSDNILPYTIEVLNGRISRYFHCKSTDGACSRNHQGDTGTNDFFHVRYVLRFIMIIPATTIAAEMR